MVMCSTIDRCTLKKTGRQTEEHQSILMEQVLEEYGNLHVCWCFIIHGHVNRYVYMHIQKISGICT